MLRRTFFSVVTMTLLTVTTSLALANESTVKFENIIAFGDSMSDNGLDDGYGFTRKSNGKIWVEQLGDMLGSSFIEDRAWSGATSGMGNYSSDAKDWSGLLWQVKNYTPQAKLNSDNTLYTVQIGTNDLHDPNLKISPQQVVDNTMTAMKGLAAKGAKHILVWNLQTKVISPGYLDKKYEWYSYYNPLLNAALTQYKEYNQLLEKDVTTFKSQHPKLKIYYFDIDIAMKDIKTKFTNTDDPWVDSYLYPEEGKWFWYDRWHYMTEVHKYIAEEANQLFN